MNADALLKELGIKDSASLDEKLAIVRAWYNQNLSRDHDITEDTQTAFDSYIERILFYKNQFLAKIGSDLSAEISTFHDKNAIQAAAMSGFDQWLAQTEIDKNLINQADHHQMTPLALACVGGHFHAVLVLYEKGADAEQETNFKQTAVFYSLMLPMVYEESSKHNKIKIFDFFKKNAPDTLNTQNAEGNNLLHSIMGSNFIEVLDSLLNTHPHLLQQKNKRGQYPIHIAILNNRTEAVRAIIGLDEVANQKDAKGRIALHYAAQYGNPMILKHCLQEKQNIDSRDILQRTPFILAARAGNSEALEILLAKGANPLLVDREGFNALHHAVLSENMDSIHWLLEHTQLDVNEQNPMKQSALSLSEQAINPAIRSLLKAYGEEKK